MFVFRTEEMKIVSESISAVNTFQYLLVLQQWYSHLRIHIVTIWYQAKLERLQCKTIETEEEILKKTVEEAMLNNENIREDCKLQNINDCIKESLMGQPITGSLK